MIKRDKTSLKHPWDKLAVRLVPPLIKWFRIHQRDLPWRQTDDPYAIWVSEMMLQQTQVVTVIPYYHRFLRRFRTPGDLADAPLEDVLKVWSGLGYYRRARHMHRAAGVVKTQWGGALPSTVEDLLKLPGIGRYTAGAVASIAFGRRAAVLDGNVMRVLTRLGAMRGNIALPQVRNRLWTLAEHLVPRRGAGTWNQALMELGAVICLPKNPRCAVCPVRSLCRARALGIQKKLPFNHAVRKVPMLHWATVVIESPRGLLLCRRSAGGLWERLWEFPALPIRQDGISTRTAARRFKNFLGVDLVLERVPGSLVHRLTHRVMSYTIFKSRLKLRLPMSRLSKQLQPRYEALRWLRNLDDVPAAAITQRIATAVKPSSSGFSK
jgi:A/G-specific adenine glycosylase